MFTYVNPVVVLIYAFLFTPLLTYVLSKGLKKHEHNLTWFVRNFIFGIASIVGAYAALGVVADINSKVTSVDQLLLALTLFVGVLGINMFALIKDYV